MAAERPPTPQVDHRSSGTGRSRTDHARAQRAFDLIAAGIVHSRVELRERLGVSASTASGIVQQLLLDDLVTEVGIGTSTGGRPPRILRAAADQNVIATAELGARHARIGLVSPVGAVIAIDEFAIDIGCGPEPVLEGIEARWRALLENTSGAGNLLAVGMALPGPVSATSEELVAPARMPGWHGARVGGLLTERLGVPAVVENDARAGALGELALNGDRFADFLYVKAGTGIGAAFISEGHLVTGAGGVAGDITHVPVPEAEKRPCDCGRVGCLETVASGRAIQRELEDLGITAASMADIVDLAQEFRPAATAAVRRSGQHVGHVLAHLVNFLNPAAVLIGGSLSEVDAFVAAVRSALYDSALAMTTQSLLIEPSSGGADSALVGLARAAASHPDLLERHMR